MKVDGLIKLLLYKMPLENSKTLKSRILDEAITERLSKVNKSFEDNEEYMLKLFEKQPTYTLTKLIRKIKSSDEIINQSDQALTKLFDNLGS